MARSKKGSGRPKQKGAGKYAAGAFDAFRKTLRAIREATTGRHGTNALRPRWMISRSKYNPHNGRQEMERRRRQMERGQLRQANRGVA